MIRSRDRLPALTSHTPYVTADGRFLINVNSDDATASGITVLQNWKPPVKQP
ncbi:MAG TPA: hypothetical protein VL173_16905 [Vicinamibacterales bacterium]|nr:hypothetical protein [Vicinamibacterales bacterium]